MPPSPICSSSRYPASRAPAPSPGGTFDAEKCWPVIPSHPDLRAEKSQLHWVCESPHQDSVQLSAVVPVGSNNRFRASTGQPAPPDGACAGLADVQPPGDVDLHQVELAASL